MRYHNLVAKYIFLSSFFLIGSCVSTKDVVYFDEINNTEFVDEVQDLEPILQKNDLLSISVSSLNPQASEYFNAINISNSRGTTATSTTSQAVGYLVDQNGYIQFPILGSVKAAGLTKKALKENIQHELVSRKLLIDPAVDIRYLNYKVSVLGEVANPSVLTVPNEKLTLLEALGLAGDLTIYASRDNILLIREEEGKKVLRRIDLTTDELFTSPYYYLKTNDIIYVEPNKTKIASAGTARQWLPVVFSGLSVVIVAIDRLTR